MLAVLGGLADVERDLIRIRTSEGRARAIALGKKMGRPPQITTAQRQEIKLWRQNGKTLKEIADFFGISSATASRIITGADSHKSRKQITA